MKNFLAPAVLAAALLLAAKPAAAFGVGASAGYSRLMNGDGQNGFGIDAFLRVIPLPLPFIDPELQVGLHQFSSETMLGDASLSIIPIYVGARASLPLPAISPWVGAHIGLAHQRMSMGDFSDSDTTMGMNIGAGIELLNLPLISVGLGAWYHIITAAEDGAEAGKMFTIGVDGSLGL